MQWFITWGVNVEFGTSTVDRLCSPAAVVLSETVSQKDLTSLSEPVSLAYVNATNRSLRMREDDLCVTPSTSEGGKARKIPFDNCPGVLERKREVQSCGRYEKQAASARQPLAIGRFVSGYGCCKNSASTRTDPRAS